MRRFVSLLSAAFFLGIVVTTSGCKGPAKDLKFAPAAPEVKQGAKVTVKVSDGKATKATAPAASKLTAKVNAAATRSRFRPTRPLQSE